MVFTSLTVDQLLELLDFFLRQFLSRCESCQERRQGTFKAFLYKLLGLAGIKLFPDHQRCDQAILILEDTPLSKFAQHRIGCGLFPGQFLLAQLYKLTGTEWSVLPYNIRKMALDHTESILVHHVHPP